METELSAGLKLLQLEINEEQQAQIIQFVNLLDKWNKAFNLTAVRNKQDMLPLHIFDSLSILPFLKDANHILDVGSGAGLPGIPLAIVQPQRKFVLLDGNGKKTRFIKQAIIELQLKNVVVIHDRVEKYSPDFNFDCITTRAFATIAQTIDKIDHLLADNAQILFMKSNTAEAELAEIGKQFSHKLITLTVPGIEAPRTLAVLSRGA